MREQVYKFRFECHGEGKVCDTVEVFETTEKDDLPPGWTEEERDYVGDAHWCPECSRARESRLDAEAVRRAAERLEYDAWLSRQPR